MVSEGGVVVSPPGPVSGYANLALSRAYGYGAITGGFFPAEPPSGTFDLDHDQRLSGVANLVYSARGFYVSATGTYGSGLTNGADPDSTYGTGLFDFNQSIKVDPSFIVSASAGYAFPPPDGDRDGRSHAAGAAPRGAHVTARRRDAVRRHAARPRTRAPVPGRHSPARAGGRGVDAPRQPTDGGHPALLCRVRQARL